jgi:HSP20 family protein
LISIVIRGGLEMATTKKKGRKTAAKKKSAKKSKVAVKPAATEGTLESRLLAPLAEFEKVLEDFRRGSWLRPMRMEWPKWPEISSLGELRVPSIDIVDKEKKVIVRAEVPGIDKDDLDVSVTDRTLTIKGSSRHEKKEEEGDIHRREIRTGSFVRTVTLPSDVDGSKAKSKFKDGVLEVQLPKIRGSRKHKVKLG